MIASSTVKYILSKKEFTRAKLEFRESGDTVLKAVIKLLVLKMNLDLTIWSLQYHEELDDGFMIIFSNEPYETNDLSMF